MQLAKENRILRVSVFGVMVNGDATESNDMDFLVKLAEDATEFDMGDFWMAGQDLLGRKLDVVTTRSTHPAIRESVMSEVILL